MLIASRSDPESILFLHDILVELCADINAANGVSDPALIDRRLRSLLEKQYADVFPDPGDVYGAIVTHGFGRPDDFVQIGLDESGVAMYAPRAIELARILFNLRQRFYNKKGDPLDNDHRRLVERMRVEVVPRNRPARNMPPSSMTEKQQRIARLAPAIPEFSRFQVEGWEKVLRVVRDAYSPTRTPDVLVIGAPTGSGKTEVFLLPLIHAIVECLKVAGNQKSPPRFILVRVPVPMVEFAARARRVTGDLEQRLGREPSAAEIAAALGVPVETVVHAHVALQQPTSLETPATEDGGLLGDVLPDAGLLPLDEEAHQRVLHARVGEALAGLADERARVVVVLHFGLQGQRAHTLHEIGERLAACRREHVLPRDSALGGHFEAEKGASDVLLLSHNAKKERDRLLSDRLLVYPFSRPRQSGAPPYHPHLYLGISAAPVSAA